MPDNDTEKAPKPDTKDLPDARVGVKDAGKIVGTTAGEAVDGRIADIADGDD